MIVANFLFILSNPFCNCFVDTDTLIEKCVFTVEKLYKSCIRILDIFFKKLKDLKTGFVQSRCFFRHTILNTEHTIT
ncbi:hypothetical protein D7Y05_08375 [bacterium 1XD42-54]|nr:hypothetical protein D7Y05_08375 [bacterium 1XD42-54]